MNILKNIFKLERILFQNQRKNMKNIKKLILITVLGAGVFQQNVYADAATQAKIRNAIKAHEAKLKAATSSLTDLKKVLHALIKDLKEALKHAPNTSEYKKLKEAVNSFNPEQLLNHLANLQTIINHLEPDLKNDLITSMPAIARIFLGV